MNILFSHFEIKCSAAASAAGEVEKAKLWTKKCTTLHSYVTQSMYKIVMQFLESFNFIHLIQRELISKK